MIEQVSYITTLTLEPHTTIGTYEAVHLIKDRHDDFGVLISY